MAAPGMNKVRTLPTSGDPHFRVRVRWLPEEVGYVLQSTENDFMYEAVDADLRIEIDGKSPFPSGSHRLSDDGFLRHVPILDFAWRLVAACKHTSASNQLTERVTVTSTEYFLEFDKGDDFIQLRVGQESIPSSFLAETVLTLVEFQQECKSVAELSLAAILRENPALKWNPHLKRFAREIEMLNNQMKMIAK